MLVYTWRKKSYLEVISFIIWVCSGDMMTDLFR